MNDIRAPFLVLAVIVMALVVLIELGSSQVIGGGSRLADLGAQAEELDVEVDASNVEEPPGRGITYLALIDVVVLYTLALMGASLVVPERLMGRVQGVVTLVGSIVLIIVGLIMAIVALVELLVMIALFTAAPFGTIAYLALWGFFPRGDAAAVLSLILFLKFVALGCLVLAHQRFLRFKRLLVLIGTSLVCNLLVAFLHGLMPIILVAILDNIAAIIVAIVAIIWAIVLLIGSIPSIVSTIRATLSRS